MYTVPLTHQSFNFNVKTRLKKKVVLTKCPQHSVTVPALQTKLCFYFTNLPCGFANTWRCQKMSIKTFGIIFPWHFSYLNAFKLLIFGDVIFVFFSAQSGFWHFAMFTKWYIFGQVCPKSSYNSESLWFQRDFTAVHSKFFWLSLSVFYASGHLHFQTFSMHIYCLSLCDQGYGMIRLRHNYYLFHNVLSKN